MTVCAATFLHIWPAVYPSDIFKTAPCVFQSLKHLSRWFLHLFPSSKPNGNSSSSMSYLLNHFNCPSVQGWGIYLYLFLWCCHNSHEARWNPCSNMKCKHAVEDLRKRRRIYKRRGCVEWRVCFLSFTSVKVSVSTAAQQRADRQQRKVYRSIFNSCNFLVLWRQRSVMWLGGCAVCADIN